MSTKGKSADFDIVVAIDDSPDAPAVARAACTFPWPAGARAHGVVATHTRATMGRPDYVRTAFDRGFHWAADRARRALARRWPDSLVALVDQPPVPAILTTAARLGAGAIVSGWHGHGALRRLLTGGSVSRGLVRGARCSVLVVKGIPRRFRRFVIGIDGSANARRATAFLARLAPPRGASVTLVRVVEPMRLPSLGLMPGAVRASISQGIVAENAARVARARRELEREAAVLVQGEWRVATVVRSGVPLDALLDAAKRAQADVLVVGARGAGGMRSLLLGSVAEGALRHAITSLFIVR